ncbi:response regulator transcription factor [Halalkalibacillus halophilus]|uniref:response regulator transcription factor n=1 Tax=Halalkalibacillus halophilus TaxID=392827 RepID=UPI0003FF4690|nr:response regulator transcription factor [Halalkalibacillus halophilus]
MSKHILVVDDEQSITTLIDYNLKQQDYETTVLNEGTHVVDHVVQHSPDLIVLDLMLPGKDGMEICKELRELGMDLPIIMLTAKGEEADKISGLDTGADDYMTKPFSTKELIARVNALLRRSTPNSQTSSLSKISFKDITISEETYEVFKGDHPISFTKKEFELLLYLAKESPKPVKREVLLQDIWDFDFIGDTRIVDVHISHLREKLEEEPKNPALIKTVRGVGYKIEG